MSAEEQSSPRGRIVKGCKGSWYDSITIAHSPASPLGLIRPLFAGRRTLPSYGISLSDSATEESHGKQRPCPAHGRSHARDADRSTTCTGRACSGFALLSSARG